MLGERPPHQPCAHIAWWCVVCPERLGSRLNKQVLKYTHPGKSSCSWLGGRPTSEDSTRRSRSRGSTSNCTRIVQEGTHAGEDSQSIVHLRRLRARTDTVGR